jgi:hypothetical protein
MNIYEKLKELTKAIILPVNIGKHNIELCFYKTGYYLYTCLDTKENLLINTHLDRITKVTNVTNEDTIKSLINNNVGIVDITNYNILDIKIKDYKKSARLFGLGNIKKSIVGSKVMILHLTIDDVSKRTKETCNSVQVVCVEGNEKRKLKFCLEDISIKYLNTKAYSLPKDRFLRIGDRAKIIKDKYLKNFKKGDIIEICDILKVGTKVYSVIKNSDFKEHVNNKYLKKI